MLAQKRCRSRGGSSWQEPAHEGIEALVGIFLAFVGEREVDHRGFELRMAHGALDEPGIHAGFKEMGGVGMPQGMDGHTGFGHASPLCGFAEGPLDTAPTHGRSRHRTVGVIPPGGRKEPGRMAMGFPGGTQQGEGLSGQGHVPVFGALPTMDMDLKTLAIDGRDLEGEGVMEPEAQALDGGEIDLVVQRGGRREETPHFFNTQDGGETVCRLRPQEREGGPSALEDVLREETDATRADTHRRGGEAVDVFPVQEVMLQFLFSNAVGGFVGELREQADCTDRRVLSPFTLATEVESSHHVLAQWGHETSPFVRRVIRLRRKTS